MTKLPPVRKRASYADLRADDLTFALFHDRILDAMAGAMGDAGPAADDSPSFATYKDARGALRWITRTTTAYKDRDQEIISTRALEANAERMRSSGQYGPLRLWHIGQPNPLDLDRPWGPGLDIGDADHATVIGKTLLESGTFRDPGIAEKIAAAAGGWEVSPGFFHPADQPDQDGVFWSIRQFERSLVPRRHGRASNLFTGLTTTKESRMHQHEIERRLKALGEEIGVDGAALASLAGDLLATEKAADRVAYKSDDEADAPPDRITINGVTFLREKAAPDEVAAEDEIEDGDVAVAEETGPGYVGDMAPAEFFTTVKAAMAEGLAPLLKAMDISTKMAGMLEEMKAGMAGVATKEAGRDAEIASLKTRLAQLEGDQPRHSATDVAAALKSEGPTVPEEPGAGPIQYDPNRPFAGWGAATFPDLYKP